MTATKIALATHSQVRYVGDHAPRPGDTPRARLPAHAAAQPHLGGAARRRPPPDGRGSGGRGAPHAAGRERLHGVSHAGASGEPGSRRRDAPGGQRLLLRGLARAHAPPFRVHAVRRRGPLRRRVARPRSRGTGRAPGLRREPDPGHCLRRCAETARRSPARTSSSGPAEERLWTSLRCTSPTATWDRRPM